MESNGQQYLDLIKTGAEIETRTGLLRGLFSSVFSRRSGQTTDFREAALRALQENAVETLATLELTIDEALKILGPGFALEDLNSVNRTWEKQWSEGASRVGLDDDERRTWWARLLAGEIKQPGTYSLRTLAIMDVLSAAEARLFTRLCAYAWILPMSGVPEGTPAEVPMIITPPGTSQLWIPNVVESRFLEDAGLVRENSATDYGAEGITTVSLQLGNRRFFLTSDNPKSLRFGRLMFTSAGVEIHNLVTPGPSQIYLEEILAEWRQESWNVVEFPEA